LDDVNHIPAVCGFARKVDTVQLERFGLEHVQPAVALVRVVSGLGTPSKNAKGVREGCVRACEGGLCQTNTSVSTPSENANSTTTDFQSNAWTNLDGDPIEGLSKQSMWLVPENK
jgi:hypothetical protein